MTPHEYCVDKVARTGSTLYYSVLYLSPTIAQVICALYAFRQEQLELVNNIADRHVAQTKLAWWHEEVERLASGAPRHPVTRSLESSVTSPVIPTLIEMLSDLSTHTSTDLQDWPLEFAARSASRVALAAATQCGYQNKNNTKLIHDLGLGCAMAEAFKAGYEQNPHSAQHAIEVLTHSFSAIEQPDRYAMLGGLTMAAIYLAYMRRHQQFSLRGKASRDLTPLAKFWIAWKTERTERKTSRKNKT